MFSITAETRQARPEDATRISRVHSESWQHAYSGIIPFRALARMINRRDANWWATAIRRSTPILIIEMGADIAGYATLGPNRVSTFPHEGEIYEIYMKPEFQGIGLGAKLFADARKELKRRGYSGLAVWVLCDNHPAISFYENAGGKAIATGSEHFDEKKLRKVAFAWD
ncbi:MAG: GNAT family N-acetyltransferase [Pseudomonadota bacterium]